MEEEDILSGENVRHSIAIGGDRTESTSSPERLSWIILFIVKFTTLVDWSLASRQSPRLAQNLQTKSLP